MAAAARENAWRPLLKLKLGGGEEDLKRIAAVHASASHCRLIVDANEAWSLNDYRLMAPVLAELGVELIEQPFQSGKDAILAELSRSVALCADESCHVASDLGELVGRYQAVNIKLDKTGGLTEALRLRTMALEQGFTIMVGCMLTTSLGIAPALLVAQGAHYVDLDGPVLFGCLQKPTPVPYP